MMDPAKLKVVELRAELSKRGLDSKGNKPVLVERLRKALEDGSEDIIGEGISEGISGDETFVDSAHKNAREKTPDPQIGATAGNRTPGRSSRSGSGLTPTKATPARINPKIVLTPIPEKQLSPAKSPIPEKQTTPTKSPIAETQVTTPTKSPLAEAQRTPTKSPTAPDESPLADEQATPTKSPLVEKQTTPTKSPIHEKQLTPSKSPLVEKQTTPIAFAEADKPEIPSASAPEEMEKPQEATEPPNVSVEDPAQEETEESGVPQAPAEETKTPEQQVEPPTHEVEEKVAPEAEVREDRAEEESSQAEPRAHENVAPPDEKEAEEDEKIEAEEPTSGEEKNCTNEQSTEGDEPMESDNANKEDPQEPMETKSEAEHEENIVKTEENENSENCSRPADESDTKVDVSVKEEEQVDVKPNIDDALQTDEQANLQPQDVEMKNVKVEEENEVERDSKDHDRRDRKDRKRKRSPSPQQEEKAKSPQPSRPVDEPDLNETDVVLSWYDSDLNLVINKESFLSATAMHTGGFGYIWAGARASYGFTEGKIYYEVKISEYCPVDLEDEQSPHVLRVGWSVQGTSMQLGEEPLTYGFGGTGKISTGNKFSDYGEAFGKDDVVGCYLSFEEGDNVVMSYTINGKDMGAAFTVSKSILEGKALFPHILTKNCTFVCNFGQEKSWSEEILQGYAPVGSVELKNRVAGPRRPEKTEECEMIMMCGLPAAGKTVWATKYAQTHPEKMFNILGTNSLIEKMKVIGLPRRRNYHGRWDALIEKCTKCLNKLLELAATRRRNYILDQTNVYPSAQRRKMRGFYGYQRRAIVIVPTEEEFKSRTIKRTASEGEVVPESGLLEMKANFGAPVVGETFDVVEWVELPAEEAKKLIEKYNKEGKEAGYGQQQQQQQQASKRPRFERNDNHRDSRDSRQNSRDNRDNRDSRDNRDNRDHRDRRNNYQDRNRNSTWRVGGGSSGGWRDRQPRPAPVHARHGGGGNSSGGSGSGSGYGGPSGGGWRGRGGSSGGPASSYRPSNDRRINSSHDRRTSGMDRNRSAPSRQGGWSSMSSYQSSQQQPSGSWGGGGQSGGSWQGSQQQPQQQQQQQQQGSWSGQSGAWAQQSQQWGNWKGYGQGSNYTQGNYSQQGYGNGNWGSWNQQYYNQYWGQQQPSGQTSTAGSQAANTSSSAQTANSTSSSAPTTYSNYSSAWQGYTQPYGYSAESSNTNSQQQK